MKKLSLVSFIFVIISLIFNSCSKSGINEPEQLYGLQGIVKDTVGKPLNDVSIYCLFSYSYIPNGSYVPEPVPKPTEVDSFTFKLEQNFPNPVYNSSFVRFAIPDDMNIEFTLKEKLSGSVKYDLSGFYYYGLYQNYLENIVTNYQLENSCYIMHLEAGKNGNPGFTAEKKLFVVSDIGKPNTESESNGYYFFDYKKACIGDTIISTLDGTNTNPILITNEINLLFKRDGYLPEIIKVSLYPELLINRDVILKKEG
jgi:hypothetical protein